ncbi:aminoglycoside phosphotransferase family protein [Streptomyces sp. PLK6-54]|uniref:Aminoglycoside phosphotransferase family protein n=1 Tax=Actinacidiphila acidipaludis TaxID=2873382 RepID=A0ABS7QF26_9ACTN|nr:aminoglycoside phosphotransferase family protein [Streptomyces acidipaludis]
MTTEAAPGRARPAIDTALVRALVARQFPQWADLPLQRFEPAGSDHVIHRLGPEFAVRLPCHAGAIGQAAKELTWLPRLAPHLPLAVPEPLGVGTPDLGYPYPWAVSRWLDGEVATVRALGASTAAAVELAEFLLALQRARPAPRQDADPGDGALAVPALAERDADIRTAIARLDGLFDTAAMDALWDAALAAPAWDRPPVWVHGDFHTGNLLTTGGRLSAVIDFGSLGRGDPAPDLTVAFSLMSATARAAFRARLGVDDATWARGRGWALAGAVNAHVSYAAVNPRVAQATTRQITQALAG